VPSITVENYLTKFENPTVNQITEQQIYVSLTYLFIGINIVFIFLAMFRFLTIKRDITYLIFALLNFIITLYNLSTYRIIIFEFDSLPQISNNEFSNYFADFMLLFYFLFFLSFLKLHKNSFIRHLLIFGCFYYCVQIFIECSDFDSVFLINFSLFFLKTTPFFNSLSYLTVFIYLAFYAKTEYYFAKYGLFSILVGTVLIALLIIQASFKINVDPIDNMFVTFLLYQISNLLDFIFFFYSLILIEKNTNTQHNELQIILENNKKELETTKKLVENENIILKDKTIITLETLIYIKADDHYLEIYTNDSKKNHQVRGKLSEIAKELPPNFIKCHRSYIINKNYIKLIQTTCIIMIDNTEIPISRGFKVEE
jgi:LytTr DNA-binding domain